MFGRLCLTAREGRALLPPAVALGACSLSTCLGTCSRRPFEGWRRGCRRGNRVQEGRVCGCMACGESCAPHEALPGATRCSMKALRMADVPRGPQVPAAGEGRLSGKNGAAARAPALTIHAAKRGISGLAVSPDGMRVASAGRDGVLRVHDLATGALVTGFKARCSLISGAARCHRCCSETLRCCVGGVRIGSCLSACAARTHADEKYWLAGCPTCAVLRCRPAHSSAQLGVWVTSDDVMLPVRQCDALPCL